MTQTLKLVGMTENNLKHLDLEIEKNKITVFTGVSGSGKSSIVFDTIANEATRQMNQTYSAFIQGFLPKFEKPHVDSIENLNPAIIIDQKRLGGNSRSTLGTITDINAHLRLLFSRIAIPSIGAGHVYSFNDPHGMCSECEGIGKIVRPRFEKLIDMTKSLNDGAILFPQFDTQSWYFQVYKSTGWFDMDLPLNQFPEDKLQLLLYGESQKVTIQGLFGDKPSKMEYQGVITRFKKSFIQRDLSEHSKKTQELLQAYTEYSSCDVCHGTRYNEKVLNSRIDGRNIFDVTDLELHDLKPFLETCMNYAEVKPIVQEALNRVNQLIAMNLGYLTLTRETSTLSGGESQRVKMMKHLSSSLNGLLYIFDEPSVGLHPRDVQNLNHMLRGLRDKGNTVLVVEHDRDVIKVADTIVDIGPHAGSHGGEICYHGDYNGLLSSNTLTGTFIKHLPEFKSTPRQYTSCFTLEHCTTNNLKNITVAIPKNVLTVVTGVAGSGKSSLIHQEFLNKYPESIVVDQKPLRASPRSNLMTYTSMFDKVRDLYAKENHVEKSLFSFNSKGKCPQCEGRGVIYTDLAFMEGVSTICPECEGRRYDNAVLQYKYKGKDITEISNLTVEDALEFFVTPSIVKILKTLMDVGVHYLTLGQPLDTLSGGECQRIKLASELHRSGNIYILDEPTTGLHMSDIEQFMKIIDHLVDNGSTVIIIEHSVEVMRHADYLIDLGPQAGSEGGEIVYEGIPIHISTSTRSITKEYITD